MVFGASVYRSWTSAFQADDDGFDSHKRHSLFIEIRFSPGDLMKFLKVLRNAAGKEIGTLIPGSGGSTILLNIAGKVLGYYMPGNDCTYQANGRLVGRGDLLLSLLK